MAEQFPESVVAKAIGHPISAMLGTLIGWLTAGSTGVLGSALGLLLSVLGGICGLAFSLIYRRYVSVLGAGAKRKGSLERLAYDKLRESLAEGGSAARLYAWRLTGFLDAVDRFFGDAGMANRTLFPRASAEDAGAALDRSRLRPLSASALAYPVGRFFFKLADLRVTKRGSRMLFRYVYAWRRGTELSMSCAVGRSFLAAFPHRKSDSFA